MEANLQRVWVDDPEQPGVPVRVRINTRSDPLGQMFASGAINEHQYAAGQRVCTLVERAECVGYGAMDYSRVRVDTSGGNGDQAADAITTARRLVEVQTIVGQTPYRLLRAFLVDGSSALQIARQEGDGVDRKRKAIAVAVEWALDDLAVWWGISDDPAARRRREDMRARLSQTKGN